MLLLFKEYVLIPQGILFQGPDNQGDFDYEREGDSYRELVTLLKDKSPKFAEMIDKQVTVLVHALNTYISAARREEFNRKIMIIFIAALQ